MKAVAGGAAVLAGLLYLNTLPAEFAYDDSRAILKNPDLAPETPLVNIFYDDFWGTPLVHSGSHKSYRPLCVLTFRLNHALHGLHPAGYHLGNVLLHAVITALYTYTASLLFKRKFPTAVAGTLFASHPIHTEAVAGVVGRADLLSCFFFLLSFLCYLRYCKYRDKRKAGHSTSSRWLPLGGVLVCTLAAMLSKEQGVTALAVCATYDVFIQNKLKVSSLLKIFQKSHWNVLEGLFSLGLIGATLVGGRVYLMGNKPPEFAPADNPASDSDSLLTRALTFTYLPFCNFLLLAYPYVLSFDWSMEAVPLVESLWDMRIINMLLFYGVLLYISWYIMSHLELLGQSPTHKGNGFASHMHSHVYKSPYSKHSILRNGSHSGSNSDEEPVSHHRTQDRTISILIMSLALLIFPFVPATNVFFYVGFVIAERVLYIPSMGFCLLVAQGAHVMHKKYAGDSPKQRVIATALVLLVCGYSMRTYIRNLDWLTEESLYRAGIAVNPAKAWGNLGSILNGQGKLQEAEEAYRAALQQRGNMADVHYNLGILLQEQKRYSEAIESYKMAIKCRPKLTMAYLNLGIVYGLIDQKTEAETMYKQCLEVDTAGLKDPRLHENTKISALYNLGRLYADQDRHQDAINAYLRAVRQRPDHYAPQSLFNMLGEAYSKVNQMVEAEHWYQEALRAKPDHIPAHLTMAKLLQKRGDYTAAEEWFFKALKIDHQKGSVYQHYAQFLGDIGRHQEAADYYIKATEWADDDFELIFNTANALRQANRNEDAEEYYKKGARLKPDVATAHMNLGAMLHFNGKLEEAEQSYLMALQLKPDDTVTRNNLKKLRTLMHSRSNKNGNKKR